MAKDEQRGEAGRKARLAQKLRENLRRRKAQMRERKENGSDSGPETGRPEEEEGPQGERD